MLDSLHLTVTCLALINDQNLESSFYLEKVFELLEMLLIGGNMKIQRSIFNYFNKNAGEAEKFFAKINEILKAFTWRFGMRSKGKRKLPSEENEQEGFEGNNETVLSEKANKQLKFKSHKLVE